MEKISLALYFYDSMLRCTWWPLLTVTALRDFRSLNRGVASAWNWRCRNAGWSRVLTFASLDRLVLVQDGHLGPHVARTGLTEFRLGDEMALEAGHIGVEDGQGDHRGYDCCCRDDSEWAIFYFLRSQKP
jgi:hypothetical protein